MTTALDVRFAPLENRVLVYKEKPQEVKTDGGIVLPEGSESAVKSDAQVVAVGPGRTLDSGRTLPMTVKKGDTVLLSRFGSGEAYSEDGIDYLIIRESDILGIL